MNLPIADKCANCRMAIYQSTMNDGWYHRHTMSSVCAGLSATPAASSVADYAAIAREMCWEIEKLPASEQQTKVSIIASDLRQKLSSPDLHRPPGWLWTHECDAELIRRDGMMCEAHIGQEFKHDPDCGGPGCSWSIAGKAIITTAFQLTAASARQSERENLQNRVKQLTDYEIEGRLFVLLDEVLALIAIAADQREEKENAK